MHLVYQCFICQQFQIGAVETMHPQPPTAAFWKFYKVENKEE